MRKPGEVDDKIKRIREIFCGSLRQIQRDYKLNTLKNSIDESYVDDNETIIELNLSNI